MGEGEGGIVAYHGDDSVGWGELERVVLGDDEDEDERDEE